MSGYIRRLTDAIGRRNRFRIFISYRRQGEGAGYAGRLADRLLQEFGDEQCFRDIDDIESGVDFVRTIHEAVGTCEVLITVIGRDWLDMTDPRGRRRLENPNDFVRLEIAAALERDVRVIPVLVGGAVMPTAEELPDALEGLSRRQAHEITDTRWDFDVGRLIDSIEAAGVKRVTQQRRTGIRRAGRVAAAAVGALIVGSAVFEVAGAMGPAAAELDAPGSTVETVESPGDGTAPGAVPGRPGHSADRMTLDTGSRLGSSPDQSLGKNVEVDVPEKMTAPEAGKGATDPWVRSAEPADATARDSEDTQRRAREAQARRAAEAERLAAAREEEWRRAREEEAWAARDADLAQEVHEVLHSALPAQMDAVRQLDPTRLRGFFDGDALTENLMLVEQLGSAGTHMDLHVEAYEVLSVEIDSTGEVAVARVREAWRAQIHQNGTDLCLGTIPSHSAFGERYLARTGGTWKITSMAQDTPTPDVQAGCYP